MHTHTHTQCFHLYPVIVSVFIYNHVYNKFELNRILLSITVTSFSVTSFSTNMLSTSVVNCQCCLLSTGSSTVFVFTFGFLACGGCCSFFLSCFSCLLSSVVWEQHNQQMGVNCGFGGYGQPT